MKKFLPLIEKYVQWVALGLGALFVLYMVYSYVIVPPVTATVGNQKVDLGNVDKVTREGPGAELERAMSTGATVGTIAPQPVLPTFIAKISNANDPAAKTVLTANGWNAPTTPPIIPGMPNPQRPGLDIGMNTPGSNQPPQVGELNLPAATFVAMMVGRSNVIPPPPPVNPVAGGAAPANPVPNQPLQPVQPVQPVQGIAGAPAVNANNPNNLPTVDKNWVSIHYKIPSAGIGEAFKKAAIPPVRSMTSFLRVELVREEQLPNGQWGNQTVVPPLAIAFVNAPAWPNGPAPDPTTEGAYIEWARANAQAILQPVFYQVVKGDLPGDPSEPILHVGMPLAAAKAFDPLNPGRGPFTDEQMALIKQARLEEAKRKAEEAKTRRAAPRSPRTPTRGGRGGAGAEGDIAYAPRDNARPTAAYQIRTSPGYRRPIDGDIVPEDMAMEDAGVGGSGGVVTQQNNEALNKLAMTIPNPNSFNPEQLIQDVDVLAYDETAEPGKTYRYQMRYYILNPILGAINLVKNPAQAQKFAVPSAPTDWSAPAKITPSVNFFLAAGGLVGDSVKLDIYKWQNGDVNKTSQTVTAGDRVGVTDRSGVDFMTPWTIVDVRVGNGDRYVLLQDDQGNTERREFKLDQNSPLHHDLDAQIEAAKAAAAAANPTGTTFPNNITR